MVKLAAPLANSRWARARWFVLAPHPDDETLGAGALIAEAAASGRLAGVAFLTDGEGSHPGRGRALAAARRAEAVQALRRLTGAATPALWLGWPDGHPPAPDDPVYARGVNRLASALRRSGASALAATAACEPHCDHAAAHRLALAAARAADRRIFVFEYLVWADAADPASRPLRTRPMRMDRRRRALGAHVSQLTARYGTGFRLPGAKRRMAARDVVHLRVREP